MAEIQTRLDDDHAQLVATYYAETRDALILTREAAHRISVDNLRHVEIIQISGDCRIEIRARR